MSCHSKEQLENMLEDVVNELGLSEGAIEKHGPLGTPPAELVRLVLREKDLRISALKHNMIEITPKSPQSQIAEKENGNPRVLYVPIDETGEEWGLAKVDSRHRIEAGGFAQKYHLIPCGIYEQADQS